ncbi:hypothetical protein BCEP4_150062 [Burkholderia cepacia]|nr:hypothetical protein BCEP4_150062 [Burkholderia cepacia]
MIVCAKKDAIHHLIFYFHIPNLEPFKLFEGRRHRPGESWTGSSRSKRSLRSRRRAACRRLRMRKASPRRSSADASTRSRSGSASSCWCARRASSR